MPIAAGGTIARKANQPTTPHAAPFGALGESQMKKHYVVAAIGAANTWTFSRRRKALRFARRNLVCGYQVTLELVNDNCSWVMVESYYP